MGKRIFISKHASEVIELSNFLSTQGDELISHSFLSYKQLEIEIEDAFDVVFFGSPRAIFFFKSQMEIPKSTEIACAGSKTAEVVRTVLNRDVAFEGNGPISTIANDFRQWCGLRKVLFPISTISLKTISSHFDESQKIEVETYETTIESVPIEACDTYVFTSPSNVKGYFEKNTPPADATIIAWGESTQKALEDLNQNVHHTLSQSSLSELQPLLTA